MEVCRALANQQAQARARAQALNALVLAFIVNDGFFREKALLVAAMVTLWAVKCLRFTLWQTPPAIGRTVSGLLAGICLVDLLAVAHAPVELAAGFLACFGLALLFQRSIPAT